MKIRVYYEDTDCGGVVYHSNYLNFCERARSELFFSKGLSPHSENEFFVVKSLEADYISSAKFGDELEVKTALLERKAASLTMKQDIYKVGEEKALFTMKVKLVFLKNSKPSKIPTSLFELFEGIK